MQIRVGCELQFECPQPTPMILTLNVHYSRASDLVRPDLLITYPAVPIDAYRDGYGNWCSRIVAPAGTIRITTDTIVNDPGVLDIVAPAAEQHLVQNLPSDTLLYLLGSRYCETDRLSEIAWSLFGKAPFGWDRVQAICSFVHGHVTFGHQFASPMKSAWDTYNERGGVCRDFAHLAIAFCRCMNIPARYCTGYLGDIGTTIDTGPMDFSGWFEAYLGNQWYTFDARHNVPRIGRVLIARGRDASDVALSTSFGANVMTGFKVWTNELVA